MISITFPQDSASFSHKVSCSRNIGKKVVIHIKKLIKQLTISTLNVESTAPPATPMSGPPAPNYIKV